MEKTEMLRSKSVVDAILSGIESINFGDGVPGSIVVYGDTATPVLTSAKPGQVVIAAAKYGKGKMVVLGHDIFIHKFKNGGEEFVELFENIKAWCTNGEHDDKPVMCVGDVSSIDEVRDCQVAMTTTCDNKSQEFLDDLSKLIHDEGLGLICGVTPWGWRMLNSDKPIEKMPISGLLNKAGMCFTGEYVNTAQGFLYTKDNNTEHGNLGEILRSQPEDLSKFFGTIRYISHLTPDGHRTLEPHIKALLEQNPIGDVFPSKDAPLSTEKNQREIIIQDLLYNQRDVAEGVKAPGIDNFPGDFNITPPLIQLPIELTFDSKFEEWHSTGYYLPAGKVIHISVNKGEPDDWMVQIGCHSDDISGLDSLKRWPKIVTLKQLEAQLSFVSPYGGLVYFRSTKAPSVLSVCIHNVLPAPYFDLTNPTRGLDAWRVQRYAPGLWAEIAGRNIIITLPAASVRGIDDPTEVIQMWDKVVQLHHELRCTDVRLHRRERFVTDVQISAGYMHAGYPIMMHLDVSDPTNATFLLSPEAHKEGRFWGPYHELGHNMQRDWWTYPVVTEVTCNIFSVHAMHKMADIPPLMHNELSNDGSKQNILKHVKNGAMNASLNQQFFVHLIPFIQLANSFGWEKYREVFEHFEKTPSARKSTTSEKEEKWIEVWCQITRRNVIPLFDFWGMNVSSNIRNHIDSMKLESYMPDDWIMELCRRGSI